VDFEVVSRCEITGGRYRLTFDAEVRHNLVWGTFASQRVGAAETRHSINTYPPFSTALPPAGAVPTLADAAITVTLPDAVVSTMGSHDLRLDLTRDPRGISGVATTSTVGLHPIDTSRLTVTADGIRGTISVTIPADGYALRSDTRNQYTLDLKLTGTTLAGTFTGIADQRDPRQGETRGTWVNED
jgi:hypothetical protein